MAQVQHSVDGKPAMTIAELQQRYGIDSYETMRSHLRRLGIEPAGKANGKTLLYFVQAVDEAMAARKGTPGRPRKDA